MHAIFLTFEFAGEPGELARAFTAFAEALTDDRELVTRTWMRDGATAGGFYVFQSMEAAETFMNSSGIRALASHPCVSDFYVRHFSTLGTIGAALPQHPVTLHTSAGIDGEACPIWQAEIDQIAAHSTS